MISKLIELAEKELSDYLLDKEVARNCENRLNNEVSNTVSSKKQVGYSR